MCLVRVAKDDDPPEPSRPVTYVRRRPSVSHSTRTSQIIIRQPSTSHHSITRITTPVPAPRPSQYITAPSSDDAYPGHGRGPGPLPRPGPLPMIVHAPTPPNRSPMHSPRTSHTHVVTVYDSSPRNSHTSVHSRQSARQGSVRSYHSRRDSQRHSRTNSGGRFIVDPPRARSRSPGAEVDRGIRGSTDNHMRRHVSVTESNGRQRSREPSRERRSKVFLTTPLSEREVDTVQRGLETSKDTMQLEDGRTRGRSITYETNPRISAGRLADRGRVLVEEDGRRREFYKTTSLSP